MLKLTPIILGIAAIFTIGYPAGATTRSNLATPKLEPQPTVSLYARTTVNPVERRREEEWKQKEEDKRHREEWQPEQWYRNDRNRWQDNPGKWQGKKRGWYKHRQDWKGDRERHWHKHRP